MSKTQQALSILQKNSTRNIALIHTITHLPHSILLAEQGAVLLYNHAGQVYQWSANQEMSLDIVYPHISPKDSLIIFSTAPWANKHFCEKYHITEQMTCYQYHAEHPIAKPVHKSFVFDFVGDDDIKTIADNYSTWADQDYYYDRARHKELFGVYEISTRQLAGVIGFHAEGGLGLLYVRPSFRGRGLGKLLEQFALHEYQQQNKIPFGHVEIHNHPSQSIQKQLSLTSSGIVTWLLK